MSVVDKTTDAGVAFAALQVKFARVGLDQLTSTLTFAQDHLTDAEDQASIGRVLVLIEKAQTVLDQRFAS